MVSPPRGRGLTRGVRYGGGVPPGGAPPGGAPPGGGSLGGLFGGPPGGGSFGGLFGGPPGGGSLGGVPPGGDPIGADSGAYSPMARGRTTGKGQVVGSGSPFASQWSIQAEQWSEAVQHSVAGGVASFST